MNVQKSTVYLNTTNEKSENETKTIAITTASIRIKSLGTNLTKDV